MILTEKNNDSSTFQQHWATPAMKKYSGKLLPLLEDKEV